MNRNIFRKEAIEYSKTKWLGKALLVSGYPACVIALLSFLFFIILISMIIFSSYTRRINVTGEVITQPHAINIFSPQQGFISKTWVKTGDRVEKGAHLYQIDVSRSTQSGNVSQNSIAAIKNQITLIDDIILKLQQNKQQTEKNLQQQLNQYQLAHEKSLALVANAAKGMEEMRLSMNNYDSYQRKGLINKDQLNNQRYLYYQQQSSYQSLNTQSIQESLQITNLQSELSTKATDFDNQISQYQYQRSDLNRQLAEVDAGGTLFINAPSDGKIDSLSVTQGQMVNAGDSLAQLVPSSSDAYSLLLWLPNSSLPYVNPGDSINIRYEAFPFEKFGQFPGKIMSISSVPASTQEMSSYNNVPRLPSGGTNQPYYKVLVALDNNQFSYQGKTLSLSSGMKAESTLFLEKRPIYQWMLSPYYDIKKSITGPIHE